MAIKKSKEVVRAQIPKTLDEIFKRGFTASVLEKKFKDDAKDARGEAFEFLEDKKEGFDAADHISGSSLDTDYGKVTIVSKPSVKIDKDGLIELVSSGKVTVETLLNIASFPTKELKTALGEKSFEDISTSEDREYLALKASAEFKSIVNEAFDQAESKETPKKETPKKVSSLEKVRKAKAKTTKAKGADSDLEDILNG